MARRFFSASIAAGCDVIADFLIRENVEHAEKLRDERLADLDENSKKKFWFAMFFELLEREDAVFSEQQIERFFKCMPQLASYENANIFGQISSYNQSILKFAMRNFHIFFTAWSTSNDVKLVVHIVKTKMSKEMIDFIFTSFTMRELHDLMYIDRCFKHIKVMGSFARHGIAFPWLEIYEQDFNRQNADDFASFHDLISAGAVLCKSFMENVCEQINVLAVKFACEYYRKHCCCKRNLCKKMSSFLQEMFTHVCEYCVIKHHASDFIEIVDLLLENGANPFYFIKKKGERAVDILERGVRSDSADLAHQMLKRIHKLQMIPFLRSKQAGILDTFVCKDIFELMCE